MNIRFKFDKEIIKWPIVMIVGTIDGIFYRLGWHEKKYTFLMIRGLYYCIDSTKT